MFDAMDDDHTPDANGVCTICGRRAAARWPEASTPEAAGRGEDCDNCGQWMPSGNPRVCGNCGMTRTLLPINERFTLYFDEEGDVIIECQRPNQFLASHGSTANEAVLDMRETLQLAASMRRPTGDKSPTEPTN